MIQKKLFPIKDYKNKVCFVPFNTIEIGPTGSVRMCGCSAWMPTTVGNIFDNTIDEILNTKLAKDIRQSIRRGTYEYCDETTCGVIANNQLVDVNEQQNTFLDKRWNLYHNESTIKSPTTYFIAGDQTCNLSCPSCRKTVIKNSEFVNNNNQQINDILSQQLFGGTSNEKLVITLSTSGEVFASSLLLNFLINFPLERYPNAIFRIQTNGLLIKERWSKISKIENNVSQIVVTADSCVPEVYEKLRRGGKFNDLVENLNFIADLKKDLNFDFRLRMVVQRDNFLEIEKFYEWSKALGADGVEYTRILNWGTFTNAEFKDIDVLDPSHDLYLYTVSEIKKVKYDHNDVVLFGFNC